MSPKAMKKYEDSLWKSMGVMFHEQNMYRIQIIPREKLMVLN